MTTSDSEALQQEFNELVKAIDEFAANASFNTITLFDGSKNENSPLIIQIGAKSGQNMEIMFHDS